MQTLLKLALRFLLLTKLKDYRRIIGIAGMGAALVIQKVLCDPGSGFGIPALEHACQGGLADLLPWLQMLGLYAGTVGVADKSGKLTTLAGVPGATGDMVRPGA